MLTSPQRGGQHEDAADEQDQMCRAQQRVEPDLYAEDLMPDHVAEPTGEEDAHPGQAEPVSSGCLSPPHRRCGKPGRQGEEAAVEHPVPRGEEGLQSRLVQMCPAIQVDAADQERAQQGCDQIL